MIYLALYSVLKGLFRSGVSLTLAPADVRPLCTSRRNWREAGESALMVMTLRPVLYVKVSPFMFCTRRFSRRICEALSAATLLCGAAARFGLSQAKQAGVMAMTEAAASMKCNFFMGVILT